MIKKNYKHYVDTDGDSDGPPMYVTGQLLMDVVHCYMEDENDTYVETSHIMYN